MPRVSNMFSEADRQRITSAVAAAEGKTAAEIVPVVAGASGRYDRAEDIAGLWLGAIAMTAAWMLVPGADQEPGSWAGVGAWVQWLAMIVALLGGYILGAVLASRIAAVRILFTPRVQMREEAAARARQVFYDMSVRRTAGATGLLIYITLYERQAVVLADTAVLEAIGQSAIDRLRDELVSKLKGRDIVAALAETIESAGNQLASALPRQNDDVNELSDALVTID